MGMPATVLRLGGRLVGGYWHLVRVGRGTGTLGGFKDDFWVRLFSLLGCRWATGTLGLYSTCGVHGSLFEERATKTHSEPDGEVKVRLGAMAKRLRCNSEGMVTKPNPRATSGGLT